MRVTLRERLAHQDAGGWRRRIDIYGSARGHPAQIGYAARENRQFPVLTVTQDDLELGQNAFDGRGRRLGRSSRSALSAVSDCRISSSVLEFRMADLIISSVPAHLVRRKIRKCPAPFYFVFRRVGIVQAFDGMERHARTIGKPQLGAGKADRPGEVCLQPLLFAALAIWKATVLFLKQERDTSSKKLENAGTEFIPENGGGVGVRLSRRSERTKDR